MLIPGFACVSLVFSLPGCFGCHPTGSEGGRCYGNGSCNDGLVCLSDTCVTPPPSDAAASDGGDAGGGDAGSGDAGGGACGNGTADPGEPCDGLDLGGATCLSLGVGFVGGTLGCSAVCTYETSGCTAPMGCGDGAIGGTEECDGADLGGVSCATLGFTSGSLGCTPGCLLDESGCSTCGNGAIEGPEACDGAMTGGATCTSLGFGGGTLGCTLDCALLDASGCVGGPPTIPVNRKPLNGAYVGTVHTGGTLRPTFAWEPSSVSGGGAIDYELEYSTDPTFASGVTGVTETATSYQPPADLVVSTSAPVGARFYWHVRACAMATCSPWSATWWVNVGRSDRDFNGDGFADLVVGAPYHDVGGMLIGQALVYFGAAGGLDSAPDLTIDGTLVSAYLGWDVATAGDVDADGFSDLLVGEPNVGVGTAYLYRGGAGAAFDATADAVLTGDPADEMFGQFLAGAGDLNGDGFDDVIVGAPGITNTDGRAHVFFGGPGPFDAAADGVIEEPMMGGRIGIDVAGAGDTNGDGYAEVLITMGERSPPLVKLYTGGPGGAFDVTADVTFVSPTMGIYTFGNAVGGMGDMNDDGFADVAIGASVSSVTAPAAGAAFFYLGSATGLDTFADGTLGGMATGDALGGTVAAAGDVNGDGFADALVGAYGVASYSGAAYLVFGGAGVSVNGVADGVLAGSGANYGLALGGVGDLNGDGFAEVAVGAYGPGVGNVYVYLGASGATFDVGVDVMLSGGADDFFGFAVQ